MILCFFFQAEDGIRDVAVTGVQTCALPISDTGAPHIDERRRGLNLEETVSVEAAAPLVDVRSAGISEVVEQQRIVERSEERRVGKECGFGGVREACNGKYIRV